MTRNRPIAALVSCAASCLALLPLLLIAACGHEPTELAGPAVQAIDAGPSFNWMNNPDNGNLRITRYETHFAVSWTDPKTGLRATHTTFPIGAEPDCGPQELLDPIDEQDVGIPDLNDFFASWFHANVKGTVWIIVRDLNASGDCYGVALVAQGIGAIHYTDNDLFGATSGDRNANAWGFSAQGTVTTPGGAEMGYSGHARFRFNERAGFKVLASQVNLH